MSRKLFSLLTLIIIFILLGGLFLLKKVPILHLENMDHKKNIHIRIGPSKKFSLYYIHSIYGEPVVEEFLIEKDSIILTGIRTKSPAVMEYYGFDETKEFHLLNQRLGAVFIMRRGMGEGQGVLINDKKIYLSEIGDRGDRIRLRVETISLGRYMIDELIKVLGLSS